MFRPDWETHFLLFLYQLPPPQRYRSNSPMSHGCVLLRPHNIQSICRCTKQTQHNTTHNIRYYAADTPTIVLLYSLWVDGDRSYSVFIVISVEVV